VSRRGQAYCQGDSKGVGVVYGAIMGVSVVWGGGGEEVRPIRRKEVRPMKGLGVVSGAGIWV
jgi:hypothetical protein